MAGNRQFPAFSVLFCGRNPGRELGCFGMSDTAKSDYLTVEDLAEIFGGRSREWVRNWLREPGSPASIMQGRTIVVRREAFEAWARAREREQKAEAQARLTKARRDARRATRKNT